MNAPQKHPKASDNLEVNAPKENPFIKEAKAAEANKKEMTPSFDIPAILVNDFAVTFTAASVRLVAAERDTMGERHVRSVMAMDYETMFTLGGLLDKLRAKAVADMEATTDIIKGTSDEKASNDTQKEVG